MSELAGVLELLHGARFRYRTARGVLRQWTNARLSERARERFHDELRAAGVATGTSYAVLYGEDPPLEAPEHTQTVVRFWSEGPTRFREETEMLAPERHEHVTVLDGTRWWTYSPEWGAVSNIGAGGDADETHQVGGGELWAALLDPSVWIPGFDFEPGGEEEWAGRAALRVRGRPRPLHRADPYLFRYELATGGDAYEFLVDRDRGVVLRAAALLEGQEFWVSAFEELAFDEQLPPETFVFEPPPGEDVRGPDLPLSQLLTIEEAARRASFPLFIIPELPDGRWQVQVVYAEPRERPPIEESVSIAYHRVDATHSLSVTERPGGDRVPEPFGWAPAGVEVDQVERRGKTLIVYRPKDRRRLPVMVACERDGTTIQLSSSDLDEETLLELAAGLERWRER